MILQRGRRIVKGPEEKKIFKAPGLVQDQTGRDQGMILIRLGAQKRMPAGALSPWIAVLLMWLSSWNFSTMLLGL